MTEQRRQFEDSQLTPDEIRQRVDRLNRMAEALLQSDPQRAHELCKQAIEMAGRANGDRSLLTSLAKSHFLLGRLLADKGDYHQSTILYLQAQSMFEESGAEAENGRALNAIGLNYSLLGAYPESLQHLLKAGEIFHRLNLAEQEAEALNNLGLLNLFLEDPVKASKLLNAGLEIAQRTHNRRLQAELLNRLSMAACGLKDHTRAIEYGLRSVEIYQRMQNHQGEIEALNSVGDAYLARNDYGRALAFFQLVTGAAERFNSPIELGRALRKIGVVASSLEQYDNAIQSVQQALEILTKTGDQKEIYKCHETLAMIYKKKGDYASALEHFEKFYQLKDSIFNEEADIRLKTLEIVHQLATTRKDAELYRLKNVDLQNEIEERKKAEIALQAMAVTDPLTGLYNRRHFFTLASQEAERSVRYSHALSVIIIDLDDFKQVNDTWGHLVGDQVLATIANHIREEIRKVDIAGRFGGDEFVILLPETEVGQARIVAGRLRDRILRQPTITEHGRLVVTVSLGVAGARGERCKDVEALLDRADQALYHAKQSGRNQVSVFGATADLPLLRAAMSNETVPAEKES
ncbi:MAG: GGDEF domain-containing protein [Anaerolineae bacterium]|nr:GGDEF domain-containing protein [Anaerolineae bacterium]